MSSRTYGRHNMRRLALTIALVLIVSACSGNADEGADSAQTAESSTTAAETTTTTTTTAAPTTTTTTTTTLPPTTTTAAPLDFETQAGTPPDVFDSFSAVMNMTMGFGDLDINLIADGVWTEDAFSCTVTSGMGGLNISESLVATPEGLWIDTGGGYVESNLFADSAQQIMSTCPASPLFWANFAADDFGAITGDEELIDGRPTVRADLADLVGDLGSLGLMAGFDGASFNQMTVWIDTETNIVVGMYADMEMSDEMLAGLGAGETGPVAIIMDFSLSQVNDPDLEIELP